MRRTCRQATWARPRTGSWTSRRGCRGSRALARSAPRPTALTTRPAASTSGTSAPHNHPSQLQCLTKSMVQCVFAYLAEHRGACRSTGQECIPRVAQVLRQHDRKCAVIFLLLRQAEPTRGGRRREAACAQGRHRVLPHAECHRVRGAAAADCHPGDVPAGGW